MNFSIPIRLKTVVIHGHSVTNSYKPEVYPNRIAIDTGALESGTRSSFTFARTVTFRLLQPLRAKKFHRPAGNPPFAWSLVRGRNTGLFR